MVSLAELEQQMRAVDPSTLPAAEAAALLRAVTGAHRVLASYEHTLVRVIDERRDEHEEAERARVRDDEAAAHNPVGDERASDDDSDEGGLFGTPAHPPAAAAPEDEMAGQGVSSFEAKRRAARARATRGLPRLDAVARNGLVNPENLDTLARSRDRLDGTEEEKAFTAHDERLAAMASEMAPGVFRHHLTRLIQSIISNRGGTLLARQREASSIKYWTDRNGMFQLHGQLDPERGGAIGAAIDRQMKSLARTRANEDGSPVALNDNLAADALHTLCVGDSPSPSTETSRTAHDSTPTTGSTPTRGSTTEAARRARPTSNPATRAQRPLIGLMLPPPSDGRFSGAFFNGEPAEHATIGRALCDAEIREILLDFDGMPLAVGRAHRTATDAQRLWLRALYATCAWPECERPFDWCQIHHLVEWVADNGFTDVDEMVPLCDHHHHETHDHGWSLELDAQTRDLRVTSPDGSRSMSSAPDGASVDRALWPKRPPPHPNPLRRWAQKQWPTTLRKLEAGPGDATIANRPSPPTERAKSVEARPARRGRPAATRAP